MADDESPKHIKDFKNLDKKVQLLINKTNVVHASAYKKAHEWLESQGKSFLDLDDDELAEKFADKMSEEYLSFIKGELKIGEGTDDLHYKLLLPRYAGATKEQLQNSVKQYGKGYTHEQHIATKKRHLQRLEGDLNEVVDSTLKNDHVADALAEAKVADSFDAGQVRGPEAAAILREYIRTGSVSKRQYKSVPGYKG